MGIAHAMGVPIINTPESATCKTIDGKMYGYWGVGKDNTVSYSKAMIEESRRLIKNLTCSIPHSEKFKVDPDGHLERRDSLVRAALREEK